MAAKIQRFHREVFFPDWFDKSSVAFMSEVSRNSPLTFSFHAVEKISTYLQEYGRYFLQYISLVIKKEYIQKDKIFEFYSTKDGVITKACLRHSFDEFPMDIITVVSHDSVIISVYITNKNDTHRSMNKRLYVKGE